MGMLGDICIDETITVYFFPQLVSSWFRTFSGSATLAFIPAIRLVLVIVLAKMAEHALI